ncbi:hypothetical protein MAXJ12_15629 [Mesorhizobium alhagi CCNWXJ12-2]|uniref:Uncharacterized protein n=1 Tax=Mesorhizobium alhagi CCNWXJ12-2 TaxID=1107882 RepID=H0HSI7_9HYPH|nr:hypothetical protein MAXJ12_15629 [Mesorhizobium alhagi CCNWXJ12-2]
MIAYYNQLHIKINFLRSAIGFLKVACAAGEGLCDINATEFVRPLCPMRRHVARHLSA